MSGSHASRPWPGDSPFERPQFGWLGRAPSGVTMLDGSRCDGAAMMIKHDL